MTAVNREVLGRCGKCVDALQVEGLPAMRSLKELTSRGGIVVATCLDPFKPYL